MKELLIILLFVISGVNMITAQLTPLLEWVEIYDGTGNSIDMTNDAKMDKDYDVYLAGRSVGNDGSPDLLILKYSRFGELVSEIQYKSYDQSDPTPDL